MAMACVIGSAGSARGATGGSTNSPAVTPTDPVLNLLLEKGMITEDEANKTQAQADALRTNMAAQYPPSQSGWMMSAGIKDMEIFGDLRLRYEDRKALDPGGFKEGTSKHPKYSPPGYIDLDRLRYALRFGVRGDAYDDFYYGFRMETSSNPRSTWVSMGTSSSGTPYYGPFGKSTAGLDVGQIYLGWRPESWFDITFGKMANPLYTTPMVWNPSINPEGAAEHLKYTVGPVDFFANFAQFLYQDTNPNETSSGYFSNLSPTDHGYPPSFLLAWQGGMDYHVLKNIDLKAAPVLYQYVGTPVDSSTLVGAADTPGFGSTYVGQGAIVGQTYSSGYSGGLYDGFASNQTGVNDLLVLEIPFELTVKLKKVDLRAFGDYAQNLEGADRARAAYKASHSPLLAVTPISTPQIHDNVAYQFGLAVASKDGLGLVYGSTAKRHAWEIRSYWQYVGQYSLDPNLIDTDFFEGVENMEGVYVAAAYGLTENFIATFRYGHAYRINPKLGTGGSGLDIPQMNPINEYDLFQIDLTYKF